MTSTARQLIIHLLGCIIFLCLPVIFSPDFMGTRGPLFSIPPFQRDFVTYLFLLGFFYFNYFVLVPRFFFKKEYLLFGSFILACFLAVTFLPQLIMNDHGHFQQGPMHQNGPMGPPHAKYPFLRELNRPLFPFLMVLAFSLLLRISTRWKQAEKERLNAELSYLKAQINPHFLFNTLNSIYSLALDRSDYTATAVVKLSGMMRYVITEANNKFVPLEKEISYISDYIELQKIRLANTIKLIYEVNGDAPGKKIAPIILIPFIENAFKYGVNPEENSEIQIQINITNEYLHLHVFNNKVNTRQKPEDKSGLGIENTKYRLQLLYPAAHELTINDTAEFFSVTLSLYLA